LRIPPQHVDDFVAASRQAKVASAEGSFQAQTARIAEQPHGIPTDAQLVRNASRLGTMELEGRSSAITQKLDQVVTAASAPGAPANAAAIMEKGREIQQGLSAINAGKADVERSLVELRANVRAYNRMVESGFAESQAAGLRIQPGAVRQYEELARDVDRIRRIESGLVPDIVAKVGVDGRFARPLSTRFDGFTDFDPSRSLRAAMMRTDLLVETRTRNYMQAMIGLGLLVPSGYYGVSHLANSIATLSAEDTARKEAARQAEAANTSENAQQSTAGGSEQLRQAAAHSGEQQAMPSGPAAQGNFEFTPAMQTMGIPKQNSQLMPSAAYIEQHQMTGEEIRKRKNYGQEWKDWFGGNPIYRYAAPDAVASEQTVRQVVQPPRVVSNSDGSQRVVTPVFDPRYIRMQSDLLGTSGGTRQVEGRMTPISGDGSKARVRGGATQDDKQQLLVQYPFLRTAGEAGMGANRTVFKLNNVEDREGGKTEGPSAQGPANNASSGFDPQQGSPVMAGAASGAAAAATQDPNATATSAGAQQ
jgi:hypothetical protein